MFPPSLEILTWKFTMFSQGHRWPLWAVSNQVLAPKFPQNLWVMSSELTELEVDLLVGWACTLGEDGKGWILMNTWGWWDILTSWVWGFETVFTDIYCKIGHIYGNCFQGPFPALHGYVTWRYLMLLDIFKWCFGTVSGADSDAFFPYFFHGFGAGWVFWMGIYIYIYMLYYIYIYTYTLVYSFSPIYLYIYYMYLYLYLYISLSLSPEQWSRNTCEDQIISQAEPWWFFAILDQAAVPPRALEQRGRCDVSFSEIWLDLKSDGWSPFFPGFSN